MSEPEIFVLADQALNGVVSRIKDDQWPMTVPAWFSRSQKDRIPTVREIVNYHDYDDAWVPDMLAGKTMDEVGKDKFKGDLLAEDPKHNFAAIVRRLARRLESSTTPIAPCTPRSATFPREHTYGRPICSVACVRATSPR